MKLLVLLVTLLSTSLAVADVRSADYDSEWQQYAHSVLRDAVAFKSVRGERQVLPLLQYLRDEFLAAGLDREDVTLLEIDSAGEPSGSLIVRYRGTSSDKRPILFVAHADVVPAAGEWERDPFVLTEDQGKFWGRGVLDDKFALAVLTTTFKRLKAEGYAPERDLIVLITGDEESKMHTIRDVTSQHLDEIDAEFAFNLDAGAGRIDNDYLPVAAFLQFAEKTYASFEIKARRPGGHSSKPTPENAIADLARATVAIHEHAFPVRMNDGTRNYFATMGQRTDGELGAAMRRIASDPNDVDAVAFLSRQPEQVGLIRTTCIPTLVQGGHAENAIPETAVLTVNCRIFPGVSVAEVQMALAAAVDDANLSITVLQNPLPAPASPLRDDVIALVGNSFGDRYAGVPIVPYMAPYATDGVYLRRAGITTYGLYGLFLKDGEDNSHSSNESLPVDRFFEALDFWYRLMQNAAAL